MELQASLESGRRRNAKGWEIVCAQDLERQFQANARRKEKKRGKEIGEGDGDSESACRVSECIEG
ncbi:MAG: hypothetical protein N2560_00620 [Ignavibacteria bacterium]|nr:hypothetical protein [Ignavibacteria bacterium]